MHSHEQSGMRVLSKREYDQVGGGGNITMGPISPEPLVPPQIPVAKPSPVSGPIPPVTSLQ